MAKTIIESAPIIEGAHASRERAAAITLAPAPDYTIRFPFRGQEYLVSGHSNNDSYETLHDRFPLDIQLYLRERGCMAGLYGSVAQAVEELVDLARLRGNAGTVQLQYAETEDRGYLYLVGGDEGDENDQSFIWREDLVLEIECDGEVHTSRWISPDPSVFANNYWNALPETARQYWDFHRVDPGQFNSLVDRLFSICWDSDEAATTGKARARIALHRPSLSSSYVGYTANHKSYHMFGHPLSLPYEANRLAMHLHDTLQSKLHYEALLELILDSVLKANLTFEVDRCKLLESIDQLIQDTLVSRRARAREQAKVGA